MNHADIDQLHPEQRKEAALWLEQQLESAPECFRPVLKSMLAHLQAGQVSRKQFNSLSKQLARALGVIPSSEKRKSRDPFGPFKAGAIGKPRSERERLEQQLGQSKALMARYDGLKQKQQSKAAKLSERLKNVADDQEINIDTPLDEIELSDEAEARSTEHAEAAVKRLDSGDGAEAELQSATEALMNATVVSTNEEWVSLPVELPEGVSEDDVVKTMVDTRVRHDFSVSVTQVNLDVEKKVVVTKDGTRRVLSASTVEIGPPRFSVTWSALATLAVLIGQFAIPFNRLATMLTTATKRFRVSTLSRMAHYVAERVLPIYLELADQLADARIMAGDDTSCRVVEVSSYFSPPQKDRVLPPWAAYRTAKDAEQSYVYQSKLNEELLSKREEGDRDAKRAPLGEPSLSLLIGREFDFESQKKHGNGAKRSLNTTVVTGRSVADDPLSTVVFYRSHLGSLGNLLEMLLRRRKATVRQLTVQSDLSTTNLVTDPQLLKRFEIEHCGCASHARRPFALHEEQDPVFAPYMLFLFKGLALHEHLLDRHGRNHENVLAVRGTDSRALWEEIRDLAKKMAAKWSKATPLGTAARYIIKHFKKLTAYLNNPRLEATNNLRERMLRTEKLIEKSSMFRRTIEGRAVLDVLRTILQTAVAAGVPPQEYLVDVMKVDPDEVAAYPERYTPRAWGARYQSEVIEPVASLDHSGATQSHG